MVLRTSAAPDLFNSHADCKSATQQISDLRYQGAGFDMGRCLKYSGTDATVGPDLPC